MAAGAGLAPVSISVSLHRRMPSRRSTARTLTLKSNSCSALCSKRSGKPSVDSWRATLPVPSSRPSSSHCTACRSQRC